MCLRVCLHVCVCMYDGGKKGEELLWTVAISNNSKAFYQSAGGVMIELTDVVLWEVCS